MAAAKTVSATLAERYATALYDLADEAKALDAVADDLRGMRALLVESDDLRRLVRSPSIGREDQAKALDSVAKSAGVHDLTRKFLGVLAANRRLFALGEIGQAYLNELSRRRGEMTAEVTSATELSDQQIKKLTDQLRASMGSKVSVDLQVDPALLGGMIVKVGSRMVDSSLRTKLAKLQLAMKGIA
ncbi:MAG: F0F1 ATP synthase subunit delta [Pseudomonadota bacterium]